MAMAAVATYVTATPGLTPSLIAAIALLAFAAVGSPSPRLLSRLEIPWRVAALLLAARAVWVAVRDPAAVIQPMVDLLLFLMCGEAIRRRDSTSDARLFSLSTALLVAAAAWRPGPAFAPAFLLFVGLSTMALATGHVRRQAELHGVAPPPIPGRFLAGLGAGSFLAVAVGIVVFAAFPRHARGWAGRAPLPARAIIGFSDRVGIDAHGATLEPDPTVVLRVEFPDGRPPHTDRLYWRGRSYDHFDGSTWSRSDLPRPLPPPRPRGGERLRQRIRAIPLPVPVVFGLEMPVEARPRSRLTIYRDDHGDLRHAGRGVVPAYEITSRIDVPPPERLRGLPLGLPPGGAWFLQLPTISARIRQLADSLTAGTHNAWDGARAVEAWLTSEFTYTTELPATAREATLDHFLFERRAGHCEYFSTAMVVLLRAAGVPARNVNGFLGGEWNPYGDYLAVTQNQAHSWVEVWFPEEGWIAFDPTPAAGPAERSAVSAFGFWQRLMDGLAFRWGGWVLDYGAEDQIALAGRALSQWRAGGSAGPGWRLPLLLLAGGLLAGAVAAPWLLRHRRQSRRCPETAVYRSLRSAYARAGLDASPDRGPLGFARGLAARQAPGHVAAGEAVRHYLQARFGAGDRPQARAALSRAARDARRALRDARRR